MEKQMKKGTQGGTNRCESSLTWENGVKPIKTSTSGGVQPLLTATTLGVEKIATGGQIKNLRMGVMTKQGWSAEGSTRTNTH